MVIIAITNLHIKINLKQLVKKLAPIIKEHFEALNFTQSKKGKTAYIRVPDKLSAKQVIQRINNRKIGSSHVKAFIPDVVPMLPLSHTPKTIPTKMRRKLKIPLNLTSQELVSKAVDNLLIELQTKYTGLYNLNTSTQNQLLNNIAKIIYCRVKPIAQQPGNDNGFQVTKTYRMLYPHNTDFQLIYEHLHSIQEAEGKPPTKLVEKQLTLVTIGGFKNLSHEQLLKLAHGHISRISTKLVNYVNGLDVNETPSGDMEAAQMKVRRHLKNLSQHLPDMVKRVIFTQLLPPQESFNIVKIYGEPYLPNKEAMSPWLRQFRPTNTIRAEHMFNLISVKVPRETYLALINSDGTIINRAKLTIRPTKTPLYKVPRSVYDHTMIGKPAIQETLEPEDECQQMEWAVPY